MSGLIERIQESAVWRIEKYADDEALKTGKPFEVSEFEGNLLLNEGINDIWAKVVGTAGTAFNNANAHLGVGDSNTPAAAAQTGLQALVNKLYQDMDGSYPTTPPVSQQVVFRSTFGVNDANWAWEEFTVCNTDADGGVNLNRKVSAQGTKVIGQTWVLTLTITLS
jgi:hypothetical protein